MGGLPGVLGMDFLSKNDAVVHCKTGSLVIGGKTVSCHGRRPNEGGQIALAETTTLLPGHICYAAVNVEGWGHNSADYDA